MKKILLVTLATFILIFISSLISPRVFAQEFDFARVFNDYLFTLGKYREAYREYVVARQAYLNYQTLTSKTAAQEKTLSMLQLRDNTVRTYLIALRMKLAESTGVASYEQSVLYLKLDEEIGWYEKHQENLPSAGSLEDLVTTAQEAEDQWKNTEIVAYQTLEVILRAKELTFLKRLAVEIGTIKNKFSEIRQRGDKKMNIAERWLLEAENRLARSEDKQNRSRFWAGAISPYDINKSKKYFEIQFTLGESHQYLKETTSFLKELIREVKSAD